MQTELYGWIIQCSGHRRHQSMSMHLLPDVFFQLHMEEMARRDMTDISRTVEDRG